MEISRKNKKMQNFPLQTTRKAAEREEGGDGPTSIGVESGEGAAGRGGGWEEVQPRVVDLPPT